MKRTVLVIEDDRAIADVIRVKLALDGWDLIETRSADEGLRLGRPAHPDLVIVDLHFVGNDGERFLREWGADRPAFLFVGRKPNGNVLNRLAEQPGVAVMTKPFRLRDLSRAAQELASGWHVRQDWTEEERIAQ